MDKWEWKRELKHLYQPKPGVVGEVDVPAMNFVMADGDGDPNTSAAFAEAVGALYGVSYTLKFDLKKAGIGPEYSVMPLEGLWWAEDLDAAFTADGGDRSSWKWTVMIAQPPHVTAAQVETARLGAVAKGKVPEGMALRFEEYAEGPSVQIMHLGPFATEADDIRALHAHITQMGARPGKAHHEIYLSDPSRTAPEKMKTVIRQPYVK